MGHNYKPEQQAANNGAMPDLYPEHCRGNGGAAAGVDAGSAELTTGAVMAYFDGNTVSVLWSLAQNYALNDNAWTTTFGPSTTGAPSTSRLISRSPDRNGLAATNHSPLSSKATRLRTATAASPPSATPIRSATPARPRRTRPRWPARTSATC